MDPETYEKVATFEELDREYSESERAIADLIWYGYADETGGSVGTVDLL